MTLIERCRTETHIVHLPLKETTITLEDVAVQLGFSIDGEPGVSSGDLASVYEELLGFVAPKIVVQ